MMRWLVPVAFAVLVAASCGGSSQQPTPTADPTQPAFVTATPGPPTPTPTQRPTPFPTANPAAVRVLYFAPGEPIAGVKSGAFVMNPKFGGVQVVEVVELGDARPAYAFSPDWRYIYAGGRYIVSRGEVVAVPSVYRPLVSGTALLSGNGRIAVADEQGNVLTVDYSFGDPRPLDFPLPLAPGADQVPFIPSFDALRAAVQLNGIHIIDFTNGRVIPVVGASGTLGGRLTNGFWISKSSDSQMTVTQYAWNGDFVTSIALDAWVSSTVEPRIDVSSDGKLVALWTAISPQEYAGAGAIPVPSVVTFFSLESGESVFRVRGGVIRSSIGTEPTLWLRGNNAIVMYTSVGTFLVNSDGTWGRGDLPGYLPIPSSANSELLAVGTEGVWNRSTGEWVSADFGIPLDPSLSPWGTRFDEVRYTGPPIATSRTTIEPIARPAIEFPPFGPDLLEVSGADGCLSVRAQPDVASEELDCLPDGTNLFISPTRASGIVLLDQRAKPGQSDPLLSAYFDGRSECSAGGNGCLWVSVETPTSQTGWVAAEYLRWPGISPPEVIE